MKSRFHHIRQPERLFEHFHTKLHHAFAIFALAIIGMLWGASNILTHTSASRQWWGFITSDFWDQNPTNANIMYALFWDGTPGNTAYTKLRDSSCIANNVVLLSTWLWWPLAANTIYIISWWTYTLTTPLSFLGDCTALIGRGNVIIKTSGTTHMTISSKNKIILDNIAFDWNGVTTSDINTYNSKNISLNNIKLYNSNGYWLLASIPRNIMIHGSQFFDNHGWISTTDGTVFTLNNCLLFNNSYWAFWYYNTANVTINNSQIFNNRYWIGPEDDTWDPDPIIVNNSSIYNNTEKWVYNMWAMLILNNTNMYNNGTWIRNNDNYGWVYYYWTTKLFNNNANTWWFYPNRILQWTSTLLDRTPWILDTTNPGISYDLFTNPQNGSGEWLLSGTNLTGLKWVQIFDPTKRPIRYIFWGNIPKQITPVRYNWTGLEKYGNNWSDYFTTRYIAEPESTLPFTQQFIVNQYFGSGSIFTQNWQTNGCSLSAFQVVALPPQTFLTWYNFQDHTIYMLGDGEYQSALTSPTGNGFVFDGNCIALIGNNNTRFTKSANGGIANMFYANNKRNIIIDNIKVDGLYVGLWFHTNLAAEVAIRFAWATNNNTINNAQIYNNSQYGILLGLWSHHNTIINTQLFNNTYAGMLLYYASNYNVINNTQMYNNGLYGIWFANGSSRNTMNNFQAYNNDIWVFWDLTTQENIINRAAIYNNSGAGIYFKNASGNILNDVRIYNNAVGIRTLYSSMGNKYYGELKMFDNWLQNFDGTSGNDSSLSAGTAWLFAYPGTLSTGSNMISCLYVTNPKLSGDWSTLLNSTCNNTWPDRSFKSQYNTHVHYEFGLNMYKQKTPVRYDSGVTAPVSIPSQYDANKYIAEVFAIRDNTPEWVNFIGSGSAQLNTWYTTNIYTAGVLNVAVPVTLNLTGGSTTGYLIISWHTVWLTWIVNNGDTIQISVLTRTGYNETITGSITIWSLTTSLIVTTRWLNQTPTTWSFAFANLTNLPLNIFTGSMTTIDGIETGVLASIIFAPITTSGRLEVYSGTTLISSWTTWFVHNGNQVKVIGKSSSGYTQTVTWYVSIGLGTGMFTLITKWFDTTPPTTPITTYPLSGEELFFVTFERLAASVDTGSGIEWYVYEIAEDSNFVDIINTGFMATVTGTIGSPNTDFDATNDTYYWRIRAKDRNGNLSARSNTGRFEAIEYSDREFTDKENANLRTYYDSNEITLEGIKSELSVQASIEGNGTLYENGNNKGTWGTLVQNGDKLYITVRSSNIYDSTTSATLKIANRELEFNITTKEKSEDGCTLSDDDKNTIQEIFDSLVENYSGDENKYDEFLYTMQSMLEDEIDFTNDCNLQYLQDLINGEIGGNLTGTVNTSAHIAPNCKEYPVNFDTTKIAYTSSTFKVITYFANRDSLTRYIDSKNPGDCHINIYGASSWIFTNNNPNRHIAANGKIYSITNDGQWYTSPDFTFAKHFNSISALRGYIDGKNPPPQIRSHQVDTSFTPQIYTAPNTKEYTIYKTDRWYMSYKLLTVRYFSSLTELQSYISRNNPR